MNVVSEGYDIKRFLEALVKEKKSQPNIDFFSREELRAVIKKFKQDTLEGKLDDNSRSSSVMLDSSTAQMFDIALNRPRTQSTIRRKQTKLVEDTVLSRHNGT